MTKKSEQTFGPVVVHTPATDEFEVRCYTSRRDCTFRIGDTCTHVSPPRKIDGLPATPDWCEMKADTLRHAKAMA